MTFNWLNNFTFKSIIYGFLIGLLILFFMKDSPFSFNWHTAQQAWQFYLNNSQNKTLTSNTQPLPPSTVDFSFANSVKKASASVVSINVYRPTALRYIIGNDKKIVDIAVGIGSGVILNNEGYIVTNYHVIKDAKKISVNFPGGEKRLVEVAGFDQQMDIALLKTDLKELKPAILASEQVKIGDLVMAIGSPFGLKGQSVSLGIVSALRLNMTQPNDTKDSGNLSTMNITSTRLMIQTDAAINTGNSGGALINTRGEVVGINRSKLSLQDGSETNINYAIPINEVKTIVEEIIQFGRVRRNWLGINAIELRQETHIKNYPNIPFGTGFFVYRVDPNSPAQQAGIQRGDFINGFKNQTITGIADFYNTFTLIPIGESVSIKLIRNDQTITSQIDLLEKPPS